MDRILKEHFDRFVEKDELPPELREEECANDGYKLFNDLLFYYPKEITESGEFIFDTRLIKIKTDPKRAEEVFEQAIKILQLDKPPKASLDCGFCKWEANVALTVQ